MMTSDPNRMEVDQIKGKSKGKGKSKSEPCKSCGKLGHKAADCWYKDAAKSTTTTSTPTAKDKGKGKPKENDVEKFTGTCHHCQKPGHKISDCRQGSRRLRRFMRSRATREPRRRSARS